MGEPCIRSQTYWARWSGRIFSYPRYSVIPDLDLITPVGDGTVTGVGRIVEDVVEL